MDNISTMTVFTLSGLNETMDLRVFIFSLTLLCYCVILLVNITLIVTIILDENLHEPMYILLCNMCINGLYGTAAFYPKFLFDLLSVDQLISYSGCQFQAFVIYSSACYDFSILAVMAYDRYVAICRSLEYHSVMTKQKLSLLVCFSWFVPVILVFLGVAQHTSLKLCGSKIEKFYCASWSIVKLLCSTSKVINVIPYLTILVYVGHAAFIVWSYIYMIRSCIISVEDRGKFMQTCVPHLLSLLNVTVALLFDVMYMRFGSTKLAQHLHNFLTIEFIVIPPLVNPIIYGLKLSKVRNRISSYAFKVNKE
ncbi:olfactory receptor 2K2-like [Aplochiton taeniatus]